MMRARVRACEDSDKDVVVIVALSCCCCCVVGCVRMRASEGED